MDLAMDIQIGLGGTGPLEALNANDLRNWVVDKLGNFA